MKRTAMALIFLVVLFALAVPLAFAQQLPAPGEPGAPEDPRYCGEPERYTNGQIKRSRAVLRHFVAVHPCPSNGLPDVGCPNWAIDHVIPLASGGCDEIGNLQWLPDAIKSCAVICKDRFERTINAIPRRQFHPATTTTSSSPSLKEPTP